METLADAMARVKDQTSLKAYCEDHLEKRGKANYVCPFCGSGTGPNHSAAFSINGSRFKCFSASCGKGGDIFDLAGAIENTEDKAEQLESVARWAGVEGWRNDAYGWDDIVPTQDVATAPGKAAAKAPAAPRATTEDDAYRDGREKHRAYIEAMRENIEDPGAVAYLASRGIDLETAKEWGLGYDPDPAHGWQDESGEWHKSGRIVIPWKGSDYYHIDRACDDRAKTLKYSKPSHDDVGDQPIWNPSALENYVFFVCEGALDALAVQACGWDAVALGNAGGASLISALAGMRNPGTALLMLDNDAPKPDGKRPGQDAQARLDQDMEDADIDHLSLETSALGTKDAAELYATDPQALESLLIEWAGQGVAERTNRQERKYAEALRRLHVVDAATIADGICDFSNPVDPIPTGFRSLDDALGGGLLPKNVYVLGGTPSMGKTSWALQLGDQVAESGNAHCLFVSVEMRASELVAKSLSRLLATVPDGEGRTHYATARDLTVRDRRMTWEADLSNHLALEVARNYYRDQIAPRMCFHEAQEQPTVADIRTIAETMATRNGRAPIVLCDYLQLLAPAKGHEREDEKSLLKRNMVALRQLAGELDTPVIVLAALSREGGMKAMGIDSFRDSSNIEFSADVLLGIQLRNFRKRLDASDDKKRKFLASRLVAEEKQKRIRELEIVIMKNRGGELYDGEDGGIPAFFDAPLSNFSETKWKVQS